jgi:hypothetical protein
LHRRGDLGSHDIALSEANVVAFKYRFDAWPGVIVAEGIMPTVETHEGGSDTRWAWVWRLGI